MTKQLETKENDYPVLVQETNMLLEQIVNLLAPHGFHKRPGIGNIVTRQYLPEDEIVEVGRLVYAFNHNSRTKLIFHLKDLRETYEAALRMADNAYAEEKRAFFLFRNSTAMRFYLSAVEKEKARIEIIEQLMKLLSR